MSLKYIGTIRTEESGIWAASAIDVYGPYDDGYYGKFDRSTGHPLATLDKDEVDALDLVQ